RRREDLGPRLRRARGRLVQCARARRPRDRLGRLPHGRAERRALRRRGAVAVAGRGRAAAVDSRGLRGRVIRRASQTYLPRPRRAMSGGATRRTLGGAASRAPAFVFLATFAACTALEGARRGAAPGGTTRDTATPGAAPTHGGEPPAAGPPALPRH